jgi:hypothetical protein
VSADSDSTFLRNFALVIGLLVGVTILLLIVVNTFSGGDDAERQALAQERAERNLAPDYAVRLSGEPAPAVASGEAEAEELIRPVVPRFAFTVIRDARRRGWAGADFLTSLQMQRYGPHGNHAYAGHMRRDMLSHGGNAQ